MTRQLQRAAAREDADRVGHRPQPVPTLASERRWVEHASPAERVLTQLALALGSGILLAVPFLIPALWWLHYGALVPWILLLTREDARRAWLYFLVGGYTFLIMALGALSLFHKAIPFGVAALYAPFLLPFGILLRLLYRRLAVPLTVLVPVLWVMTEWLRLRYSLGAVAFFPLGTSQFRQTTLIQIADLTGVYGLSFLIALANGALADIWKSWQSGKRNWRIGIPAAAFLLLLMVVLGYGKARQDGLRIVTGPRVAIVQPNAIHYRDRRRAVETYEQQLRFTRAAIAPGSADVIAWPENAIGEPVSENPRYLEGLAELARYEGAHLLVGGFSWAMSPGEGGGGEGGGRGMHTSAYYISPEGAVVGRYDKIHMIPYSEYVPFRGWLRRTGAAFAQRLLGYISPGMPGRDVVEFPIRTSAAEGVVHFAVPICFEVSSSGFARDAAAGRADFLINITSEGLLGPPMYVHMLAHSTLRAVENRVAVVRVANNALSGLIDPLGRARLMRSVTGGSLFRDAGTLIERVPVNAAGGGSFYTRYGDVLAYFCGGGTLILVLLVVARRRSSAASAPRTESRP